MNLRRSAHTKGFTLIELLVVISIIGLMSSVVLGSLAKSREKAQLAKAQQEFKQIGNALELYRSANGNQYPDTQTLLSYVVSTYLTPYLKTNPRLPAFLPSYVQPHYAKNPAEGGQYDSTSDDYYYSCNDESGTEPYVTYFYIQNQHLSLLPKGVFPQLKGYRQDGNFYSFGENYFCLFNPPK